VLLLLFVKMEVDEWWVGAYLGDDKNGKVPRDPPLLAVVTGATSGIGRATVELLARLGVQVVVTGRNIKQGKTIVEDINLRNKGERSEFMELDLSSLESVDRFCSSFSSKYSKLNILINNAAILPSTREFTWNKDGVFTDSAFASNHLGHFYLTNKMMDLLKKGHEVNKVKSRIINLSSYGHYYSLPHVVFQHLHLIKSHTSNPSLGFDSYDDDNNYSVNTVNSVDAACSKEDSVNNGERKGKLKRFSRFVLYANTKLYNLVHIKELQRRCCTKDDPILAFAIHPGVAWTNIWTKGFWRYPYYMSPPWFYHWAGRMLWKTPEQAAYSVVVCATSPTMEEISEGDMIVNGGTYKISELAKDKTLGQELWSTSQAAVNTYLNLSGQCSE